MKRELNVYDLLKAAAILLVVLGHVTILFQPGTSDKWSFMDFKYVTDVINLFHMPLFMAISGAVYQIGYAHGKYREFCPFAINKSLRLIIPYLTVGLLFLLPVLAVIDPDTSFGDWNLYSKILLAKDTRHLWYVLALFWIFGLQFMSDRLGFNRWMVLGITLFIAVIETVFIKDDFFCIRQGLFYWPCFLVGIIFESELRKKNWKKISFISLLGVTVWGGLSYISDSYVVDAGSSYLMRISIVILLISFSFGVIKMSKIKDFAILQILADTSFAIYLFHVSVIFLIKHFCPIENPYVLSGIMFLFGTVLPILTAFVLRRIGLKRIIGE